MNGTAVGQDLSQILVYSNSITNGLTAVFMILAFFLVVFLGSALASFRFTGRVKLEIHFAAAAFATFGFTIILDTINGFVNTFDFGLVIAVTLLSVLWILISNPNENY